MTIEQDQLMNMAVSALETTAFMILDPLEGDPDCEPEHHSTISIDTPSGVARLLLSASDGFLAELASSMLGMDESEIDISVEGKQALLELANILGGEIVMALGGENDAQIVLGLPEEPNEDDLQAMQAAAQTVTQLDSFGEVLSLRLSQA